MRYADSASGTSGRVDVFMNHSPCLSPRRGGRRKDYRGSWARKEKGEIDRERNGGCEGGILEPAGPARVARALPSNSLVARSDTPSPRSWLQGHRLISDSAPLCVAMRNGAGRKNPLHLHRSNCTDCVRLCSSSLWYLMSASSQDVKDVL